MNKMINIYQGLVGGSTTAKNSLTRMCLGLLLAAGLLTSLPAISAPILVLQPDFVGIHGVDHPVLDPVFDFDEGDAATTDYLFEWAISSYDTSGTQLLWIPSSDANNRWPFDMETFGESFFPTAGNYTVEVSMVTFHQDGGLAGCGPNSGCFDNNLPFLQLRTIDTMNVQLGAVPVPPAVWLFASGLLGLVGIARRKVHQ